MNEKKIRIEMTHYGFLRLVRSLVRGGKRLDAIVLLRAAWKVGVNEAKQITELLDTRTIERDVIHGRGGER